MYTLSHTKMPGFTIDDWTLQYKQCSVFAEKQITTSRAHYKRRNQSNSTRIVKQITDGKMGEIIAARYLRNNGFDCNNPDFEIYSSRKKSFEADLFCGQGNTKQNVHVKTQNSQSAARYGSSWVFQAGGAGYGHSDPCLGTSNDDWCVFVTLDCNDESASIVGPLCMTDVHQHFKDPKLSHLVGIKKCVYLEDIAAIKSVLPPPVHNPHHSIMDLLERLMRLMCQACNVTTPLKDFPLTPGEMDTATKNNWITVVDGEIIFDKDHIIDIAFGKVPLDQYAVTVRRDTSVHKPPSHYTNTASDTDDSEDDKDDKDDKDDLTKRKKRKLCN